MILTVLLISMFSLFLFVLNKKPPNFPPGPKGLPVIGNIHQLGDEPYKTFQKWRKKYGDIFSLKFGSYNVIVLTTAKDIKNCLAENAFSGRGYYKPIMDRTGGVPRGIIFNSGHNWTEQSRFTLKSLRDFGFGRRSVESIVLEEADELIDDFQKVIGKPMTIGHRFSAAVINVLWSMVTGQRYTLEDPQFHDLIKSVTSAMTQSKHVTAARFIPLVYSIRKMATPLLKYAKERQETIKKNKMFASGAIEEHRKRFSIDKQPDDFIDAYLKEIEKTKDTISSFYKEEGLKNLTITLTDLFVGGVETTATALSWLMILMAMHPEKQEKLHAEIRQVIGLISKPSLNDRDMMPYTEAVIREVLRFSSLAPLGVLHATQEDTTYLGYRIPKDTVVVANLYGVLHDPEVWGDPEVFRPERFLCGEELTLLNVDAYLPFSTGKRVCLGMAFAKDQLFLFTTSLFQKFRVGEDPNQKLQISYHKASILIPKPQSLILYERN